MHNNRPNQATPEAWRPISRISLASGNNGVNYDFFNIFSGS
jgi:hypothetical protein